ncbi:unnamed protein product [Heligmosomoides polygyrus]|uniref:Gamma interferon inducible lysosomal thiol reductase GILT n=1 Tax=Heligmosomoides polygyrus TaxID=6339 RepID=A0A183GL51_HELPZ|nr:unnamed protein product [Heligmosomoides polygyrus]
MMRTFHYLAVLLAALRQAAPVVTVDVVGESMCPFTTRFVHSDLVPVYEKYRRYLRINYHPSGRSENNVCVRRADGIAHGAEECKKNALIACLINYVPRHQIESVACVQPMPNLIESFLTCVAGRYPPGVSNRIHECATGDEGREYLVLDSMVVAEQVAENVDAIIRQLDKCLENRVLESRDATARPAAPPQHHDADWRWHGRRCEQI